jgi:hypothetical protein
MINFSTNFRAGVWWWERYVWQHHISADLEIIQKAESEFFGITFMEAP